MRVSRKTMISLGLGAAFVFAVLAATGLALGAAGQDPCRHGKVTSFVTYGAAPGHDLGYDTSQAALEAVIADLSVAESVEVTPVPTAEPGSQGYLLIKDEVTVGGFSVVTVVDGRYLPNDFFVCTDEDGHILDSAELGFEPIA